MECRGQGARECRIRVPVWRRLDKRQQLHPGAEEAGAERDDAVSLNARWILAEEVEIEADVEDAEVLLIIVRDRTAPDRVACRVRSSART